MPVEALENQIEKLLFKLREAGPAGLTKGKLGVKDARGRAGRALRTLMSERKVANLGTTTRTSFVLIEHFNPFERACEQIEKNALCKKSAREATIELLIKKDLEKGCEGEVRKKTDEAIDWLVKERRLHRFRRSRTLYYVHAENWRGAVHPGESEATFGNTADAPAGIANKAGDIDRQGVLGAYQRLRQRLEYNNVEISELRREAGCPLDLLKIFLLEESRQGRAVLSLGDWSVSSEETRTGAIELFGKPHLLVRLDAE